MYENQLADLKSDIDEFRTTLADLKNKSDIDEFRTTLADVKNKIDEFHAKLVCDRTVP